MSDIAIALVATLSARGIRLRVRGKKLEVVPASAYGLLSVDERSTLKQHKRDIIALVRAAGPSVQIGAGPTGEATQSTLAPALKPPCPHCYKQPCIGERHELYDTMHPLSERQIFEREQAQLKRDVEEKLMRLRYGLPSPMWDAPSPSRIADLLDRRARGEEG